MLPRLTHQAWGYFRTTVAVMLALVFAEFPPVPAYADGPTAMVRAERAYTAGDFDAAAGLVRGDLRPAAQMLAARAMLTKAMLLRDRDSDAPRVAVLASAAMATADAARQSDPGLVEAYVQGAIARGLIADQASLPAAVRGTWAARALIDAGLRLAPSDPTVLATDAGWHLTLTGRLGTVAASLLFSASRDHGLAAFERVFALVGDDPSMLYHFAKVRMQQSDQPALDEARAALQTLGRLKPTDALGKAMQQLGPPLLAAVEAGSAEQRRPAGDVF